MTVTGTVLLLVLAGLAAASAGQPPHVLFIVADDHGFHDCSFTGSDIQTPTIDWLRSRGIALEQVVLRALPR